MQIGHFNEWLSSVLTAICVYPLYTLRTRLIMADHRPNSFHDLLQLATQINQEESYKGFFLGTHYLLSVPYLNHLLFPLSPPHKQV